MLRVVVRCLMLSMTLLVGCAKFQMTNANVALMYPLIELCIAESVRSDPQIVGFRKMNLDHGHGPSYSFEIADPTQFKIKHLGFVVRQTPGVQSAPQIEITSNFPARLGAARLRESVLQWQQDMLSRIVEQCTDREAVFVEAAICGKGEKHTLCARGELR